MNNLPRIPDVKDPVLSRYLRDLSVAVSDSMRGKMDKASAVDSVLLVSPSKKIYRVSVDDDGYVITELVQE